MAPHGHCTACSYANPPGARFCNQCGAGLEAGVPEEAEAERKQVSVLFSDLTGYTALSERLDPEDTREIMGRIFERAAEIVGRYDGRIEKFIGDAIMAIFGVPTAHEDDPVRAVRAALELHEAVAALSPDVEARAGSAIALHSGINTGLVVTGELKFDRGTAGPLGDTINLAARLMDGAGEGEIWIGPETRRLVGRAFELDDLGERAVRGKEESVPVARVRRAASPTAGPAPGGTRFRGAFVGRQEELGVLLGAADRLRDGRPSVIAICGDAGTGKTRLLDEFRARVGDDVQWLEGRAYPYAQNIPYSPLIDLLSRSWGIEEGHSPAEVRQRIEAGISSQGEPPGDVLPVMLRLYGLELADGPAIDREAYQGRLLDAVGGQLTALASRAPTVICLQDLHWADVSTVTLLRGLTASLRAPALLVGNYRPGFTPGPAARVLQLGELSSRQTRELVASLLDDAHAPEELLRFIEERSDGNPFYVEEVVKSLVETYVLTRSDDRWQLSGPLSDASVPTTIRGVIAARIDRLDEPRRRVLRDAAVVGREFLFAVVAQVTREADELEPSLEQLEAADLIRASAREPDVEYIFKHALTQEVAYDGLLRAERQALHERAAFAMERVLRDRIPEFVETLAYHFLNGGVVDKAVHYLRESGRKCLERYAIEDADTHYRRAYELLVGRARTPEEDRALVELLCDWSLVHYYTGDCAEWRSLLEAHLDVAESVADPELLGMMLGWAGHMLYWHEEHTASLAQLDRAVLLAEQAGSKRVLGYAETWRSWTLSMLGRTRDSIEAGERAVALARLFPEDTYLLCKPLGGIAQAACILGDLERARLAGEELLEIAERTGNSRAAVIGHFSLAARHALAGEPDRGVEAATLAMEASRDPAYRHFSALALCTALSIAERPAELFRVLDAVLPEAERLSQAIMVGIFRSLRATGQLALGEPARGFRSLQALRDQRDSGFQGFQANLSLGIAYARIARGDGGSGGLSVVLRNPGFVIRHALRARRRALAILEPIADAPRDDMWGYSGSANLELAQLHAGRGEREQARSRAARAREVFERMGAPALVRRANEVVALLGSVD